MKQCKFESGRFHLEKLKHLFLKQINTNLFPIYSRMLIILDRYSTPTNALIIPISKIGKTTTELMFYYVCLSEATYS